MKKVLIINGSPRKAATLRSAEIFAAALTRLGTLEVTTLHLAEKNLGNCRGCHLCIQKDEALCPLHDDRDTILQAIREADGVVFATPVYSQNVSTLMKNLIDHLAYQYHRPSLFGIKAMALASGGGQFRDTLRYMNYNASCWGMIPVTRLGIPHLDALTDGFRKKVNKSIEKTARKFFQSLQQTQMPDPGIKDLMWFRMWQITAASCMDSNPADYRHYEEHGWFRIRYYYPARISFMMRVVTDIFTKVLRAGMRKMYKGY